MLHVKSLIPYTFRICLMGDIGLRSEFLDGKIVFELTFKKKRKEKKQNFWDGKINSKFKYLFQKLSKLEYEICFGLGFFFMGFCVGKPRSVLRRKTTLGQTNQKNQKIQTKTELRFSLSPPPNQIPKTTIQRAHN